MNSDVKCEWLNSILISFVLTCFGLRCEELLVHYIIIFYHQIVEKYFLQFDMNILTYIIWFHKIFIQVALCIGCDTVLWQLPYKYGTDFYETQIAASKKLHTTCDNTICSKEGLFKLLFEMILVHIAENLLYVCAAFESMSLSLHRVAL